MRVCKRLLPWAALAAFSTQPTFAQEAEPSSGPPAPPESCEGEAFRAFDFWIGEWEVRVPDGRLAGHNSIQPINNGCALLERYAHPGMEEGQLAGQSYNFYDPVRETWTQLWLSPGIIIRMEGPVAEPGTLILTGTITYTNRPEPQAFRGEWTLRDDGAVVQEFWAQDSESGEWANWFTGIYTRTD